MTVADGFTPLTLVPIGVIRTKMRLKFDAPHQPDAAAAEENVIELVPRRGFEQAVRDLEGFERIWIVWWFHRNVRWRPLVLPPRGEGPRRGLFATRSPHRPNPLGLTATTLLQVSGLRLTVGPVDLLDGTPILDIKPYISAVDAFPGSANGWLAEVEREDREPPGFTVEVAPEAAGQLAWLKERWQVDFFDRARRILERNPHPHRTRRITRLGSDRFRIGCGAWRLVFALRGTVVEVLGVVTGYPERLLCSPGYDTIPDRDAQLAFGREFKTFY